MSSPKGVLGQIAFRLLRRNMFQSNLRMEEDSQVRVFCTNMFNRNNHKNVNYTRAYDGILLMKITHNNDYSSEDIYGRCIYKGSIYHSALYARSKKIENSYVLLSHARVAHILYFL